MKKVFSSHSEVAHVWAQRTQKHGRAGNIFFSGESIYSYGRHYEIARFEKSHVLLNDTGYSSSTGKHIGIVQSAISNHDVFNVSTTLPNYILGSIKTAWAKIQKARKPDLYYKADFLSRWNEYLNKFDKKEQTSLKDKYKNEIQEIKKLQKKLNNFFSADNIKELVSLNIKKDRDRKEKAKKEAFKDFESKVKKFRAYEIDTISSWNSLNQTHSNKAYLRISKDGQNLETSKGVKVALPKAKMMLDLIRKGVDVTGRKIDYYTINKVTLDHVAIGCHTISFEEINKIKEL